MALQPWSMDIKDYVFLRPESEYNFLDSAQNQAWQEEEDGGLFQVELCPPPSCDYRECTASGVCNKACSQLVERGLPPS